MIRGFVAGTALVLSTSVFSADVAIDVGHSLAKPGSVDVDGVPEFQYNQRLAKAVAKELEDAGYSVHRINFDGSVDQLAARPKAARSDKLFLSIHHDSVQPQFLPVEDPRFSGFSVWVSRQNPYSSGSFVCAQVIGEELVRSGFSPSHYHADRIKGENHPQLDPQRGVFANDRLAVLRMAWTPAVLVEAGVIVNPVEVKALRSARVLKSQSAAIARGVISCLPLLENR